MPRPRCCRRIAGEPACKIFKPAGTPASSLEEVVLSLEEYEAIRLADHEGLYQEDAAARMGVSRQTFGRATLALAMPAMRDFTCRACAHAWQEPFGTGRPAACPACGSDDFHRAGCTGNASPCGHAG